jgi:hypothetical protein
MQGRRHIRYLFAQHQRRKELSGVAKHETVMHSISSNPKYEEDTRGVLQSDS